MISSRWLKPLLPLLLIWATGCSHWPSPWWSKQRPKPVEAVAELPPEAATEPDVAQVTDPHQDETVAQVLEFVDRLAAASDDDQQAAPESDSAWADRSPFRAPAAGMTANEPIDVNSPPAKAGAAPEPAPVMPPAPVIESVFVRGSQIDGPAEPEAGPASAANSPLSTDPPQQNLSLEQLIGFLADRVAAAPEDAQAQWKLRLLYLVNGDEEAARQAPAETADDYSALVRGLVEVIIATRDALEDPVTASDTALAAAGALRDTLSEHADLQIPAVALCTRVQTFGIYDEMPPAALIPNQANRVIVYIEIANFSSEQSAQGQYRTALTGELEVLTAAGAPVWHHEEPDIVDWSRQRRHDFFLAQLITLPGTLGAGDYALKVTIQDELSGKSNQAILPFSMGMPAVAKAPP